MPDIIQLWRNIIILMRKRKSGLILMTKLLILWRLNQIVLEMLICSFLRRWKCRWVLLFIFLYDIITKIMYPIDYFQIYIIELMRKFINLCTIINILNYLDNLFYYLDNLFYYLKSLLYYLDNLLYNFDNLSYQ
jgi:hypothetical protein